MLVLTRSKRESCKLIVSRLEDNRREGGGPRFSGQLSFRPISSESLIGTFFLNLFFFFFFRLELNRKTEILGNLVISKIER